MSIVRRYESIYNIYTFKAIFRQTWNITLSCEDKIIDSVGLGSHNKFYVRGNRIEEFYTGSHSGLMLNYSPPHILFINCTYIDKDYLKSDIKGKEVKITVNDCILTFKGTSHLCISYEGDIYYVLVMGETKAWEGQWNIEQKNPKRKFN